MSYVVLGSFFGNVYYCESCASILGDFFCQGSHCHALYRKDQVKHSGFFERESLGALIKLPLKDIDGEFMEVSYCKDCASVVPDDAIFVCDGCDKTYTTINFQGVLVSQSYRLEPGRPMSDILCEACASERGRLECDYCGLVFEGAHVHSDTVVAELCDSLIGVDHICHRCIDREITRRNAERELAEWVCNCCHGRFDGRYEFEEDCSYEFEEDCSVGVFAPDPEELSECCRRRLENDEILDPTERCCCTCECNNASGEYCDCSRLGKAAVDVDDSE